MERNEEKMKRQSKVMSIIALAVCVVGLTIGFAAFSNTLTIKSSATVTPNSSDFSIDVSSSKTSVEKGTITPTGAGGVTVDLSKNITTTDDSITLSGLTANFTEPGQSTTYTFYIHNTGKYTTYFKGWKVHPKEGYYNKKCTADSGNPNTLVNEACDYFYWYLDFPDFDNGWSDYNLSDHDRIEFGQDSIYGLYSLDTSDNSSNNSDVLEVQLTIMYDEFGPRVDEEFTVEFGDIEFFFSSVD